MINNYECDLNPGDVVVHRSNYKIEMIVSSIEYMMSATSKAGVTCN